MKKTFYIKRLKLYLWVGLAFMLLSLLGNLARYPGVFGVKLSNEIWTAVYIVALNFIFFEYTLPFIRRRRRYIVQKILIAFIILFAQLLLFSFGLYVWRTIGIGMHIYTELRSFTSEKEAISYHFSYSLGSLFFFGIIIHIYDYNKLKRTAQTLLIEKQQAELNYLKSQTNPHFLFNTLNNIYSLSRDKSDLAPESILRLSKILRYMLYEAGGAYIAIEQELKVISDYIALEKLRYDDSLRVNFNHDIEDMKQALPPLLLIPLVENAFKHGVSETRNHPFVDIHLSVNKRQLAFLVKNSSEEFQEKQIVKENIGLSNLRRQLELLYTDFSLTVQKDGAVFTATLKINLASHV
jgi:two-component system, LytTR family, sensor kinase